MSRDRRTDGPSLLQAKVTTGRRWGRRQTMTVRVTSRELLWGSTSGGPWCVPWTDVVSAEQHRETLCIVYADSQQQQQTLRVALEGPVGYLLAEEVVRRSLAAAANRRELQVA